MVVLLSITGIKAQWEQTTFPSVVVPWCSASHGGSDVLFGTDMGGLYITADNGETWSWSKPDEDSITGDAVISIVIKDSDIFIGTFWQIFLSSDNGNTWVPVTDTFASCTHYRALAIKGTDIFAGTDYCGIIKSSDNGNSWFLANNGLPNCCGVNSLVVNDSNIFAGTYAGIFISSDNGSTWSAVNNGLTDTFVLSLTVKDSTIFAGTQNGGIYFSTDNGNNWTASNNGLTLPDAIHSLVPYPNSSFIFAGTYSGVFLSYNDGNSWVSVSQGLPANPAISTITIGGTYAFAGTLISGVWRRQLLEMIDGIGENNNIEQLSLYPNPTNGEFVLKGDGIISVLVQNVLGVIIFTSQDIEQSSIEIDLSNYPKGIYFVNINKREKLYRKIIVIQ